MTAQEKLILEVGKTYRTRNGCEVEVLKVGMNCDQYPVAGVLTHRDGRESIETFTSSGVYNLHSEGDDRDIISEIKPKNVLWLNVDPYGPGICHPSRESADECGLATSGQRAACIRVEWEYGQLDEETN